MGLTSVCCIGLLYITSGLRIGLLVSFSLIGTMAVVRAVVSNIVKKTENALDSTLL